MHMCIVDTGDYQPAAEVDATGCRCRPGHDFLHRARSQNVLATHSEGFDETRASASEDFAIG